LNRIKILNVDIDDFTKKELINELTESIKYDQRKFLVTANPEIVMMANKDLTFAKAVREADYVVADGIGLIIGSKILGHPLKERIPGVELMQELLDLASRNHFSVYLYGAKPEVLKKLHTVIKDSYPGVSIAGYSDGYTSSPEEVAKQIEATTPDLVFVALGAPKQEKWIDHHYPNFSKGVFVGVGGSFDVLSGTVKRAPKIWRTLNLEWLYRIIKQPSRWKRALLLPAYLAAIVRIRLRQK